MHVDHWPSTIRKLLSLDDLIFLAFVVGVMLTAIWGHLRSGRSSRSPFVAARIWGHLALWPVSPGYQNTCRHCGGRSKGEAPVCPHCGMAKAP
jgi:hypothetical protein